MELWPATSASEHNNEESIDFDQVIFDLSPAMPEKLAPTKSALLVRHWFRAFDSPRLYRLGQLLNRGHAHPNHPKAPSRHIIFSRCGRGRTEQLQISIAYADDEHVSLAVDGRGIVRLWFEPGNGPIYRSQIDQAGEAGLARFVDDIRRLTIHLEHRGHRGIGGVLRSLGFQPS